MNNKTYILLFLFLIAAGFFSFMFGLLELNKTEITNGNFYKGLMIAGGILTALQSMPISCKNVSIRNAMKKKSKKKSSWADWYEKRYLNQPEPREPVEKDQWASAEPPRDTAFDPF